MNHFYQHLSVNINLPLITSLEILSSVRILKVDPIFVG